MSFPKIAFIGAGSTVFMKNIVGDVLQWEALKGVHFSLMDINEPVSYTHLTLPTIYSV